MRWKGVTRTRRRWRRRRRSSWRLEDVIGADKQLDFGKPFMPESLARVAGLDFLSAGRAAHC